MDRLKVCFIGVGSIAKRHIRNLRQVCEKRGIKVRMDAYRHSKDMDSIEGIINSYSDITMMPDDYDAIFITNPTEFHLSALERFHSKGKNFFIEKPLVPFKQIEDAERFQARKDTVYYIAAPLRYNAVIQYIKNNIDPSEVFSVRSISSSYLPEWRPGQDYRDTYSAHKDLGGGVSTDLIHEWDYLSYLFGRPEKVCHFMGKKSKLEIDCEDLAVYIAEYPDKIIELHLDYCGRKAMRNIELFAEEDTIIGDILNNRIQFLRSGKEIDFQEERDDYQRRELEHFLDMVLLRDAGINNGIPKAIEILRLTQGMVNK